MSCSRGGGSGYGGGDWCWRRQNYYYYCYYDTRRGEYYTTTSPPSDRYEKYENRETSTSSGKHSSGLGYEKALTTLGEINFGGIPPISLVGMPAGRLHRVQRCTPNLRRTPDDAALPQKTKKQIRKAANLKKKIIFNLKKKINYTLTPCW